jgi:hypothetical protein
MSACLCVLIAIAVVPNQGFFKNDSVSILVDIQSNIFTYKVTNLSESAITHFDVQQHVAYNFLVPDGWDKKIAKNRFQAFTDKPGYGIQPGQTKEFSLRVSSRGATLSKAPAIVKFVSGNTTYVPDVWAAAGEPRSYVWLIITLVLVILLSHSSFLIFKDRRGKKEKIKAP